MAIDRAALAAGSVRLASGVSTAIGLGGAAVGIGVGLWGATRRR